MAWVVDLKLPVIWRFLHDSHGVDRTDQTDEAVKCMNIASPSFLKKFAGAENRLNCPYNRVFAMRE